MGNSEIPAHGRKWVGRSLPRFEDLRLVRGAGQYTDDISQPGQAYAVFLRSPHAHARIDGIDKARAKAMPGVLAVLTDADYQAAGLASLPTMPVPAGALDVDDPVFKPTPETPILVTPQWPLAGERVRFPGEPVAMIVAETIAQAHDAAEAIEVSYEALPAVTSAASAVAKAAPVLWPLAPGNVAFDNRFGDAKAVEAALAQAHLVVEQTYENPRISSAFMEPRGGIASYDGKSGRYTLMSGCQGAHRVRMGVCGALKEKPENIRVICPDTGGGFGSRNDPYPEQVCILWAAKLIGRPVKWTNDRTESQLTD
ncbi:MAG: aldehyde oxidase and xanthine dehydrogenase molybdopterin binding, partial [Hyphomicrobiales bacterium]|nr:aldehyde oxidase and xanthine dehydrogenase molybdopterin binding [Hyphomicrobiales bacterium]